MEAALQLPQQQSHRRRLVSRLRRAFEPLAPPVETLRDQPALTRELLDGHPALAPGADEGMPIANIDAVLDTFMVERIV